MKPEPSNQALEAVAVVRDCIGRWPKSTYSLAYDGPSRIDWEPSDGYCVEWEIKVEPVNNGACPLELWFLGGCPDLACVAFGFDSWRELANRLDLKSSNTRFVFGVEPISISAEQLITILTAVYEGHLEARYFSIFGRFIGVSGRLLADVNIPHICRSKLGAKYQYSSYAAA